MSAPFQGRRVVVAGTSRAELNGVAGVAEDYNRETGRYNVRLDTGQVVALKPAHLEEAHTNGSNGSSGHAPSPPGASASSNIPWPLLGLGLLFAVYAYQSLFSDGGSEGGGASLFGDDFGDYDDGDEGYLEGLVREVVTLDQYRGALAQHSDSTGLPVVVDFFSHSCGPCRMMVSPYKRLAKEFKGRAAFLKIDVNRNYEAASACHVRGLPTFQFYLNRKKVAEFSGADERALRRYTASAVEKSEEAGTFVGKEVTAEALRTFYQETEPSKVEEAEALAAKYAAKTALLMRVSRQKYGKTPLPSPRGSSAGAGTGDAAEQKGRERSGGADRGLAARSIEELQAELAALSTELQRRGLERPGPPSPASPASSARAAADEEEDEDQAFLTAADVVGAGVHKVVIVGGGPAGLSAATYSARAGLRPVVLAPAFGGQLLGKGVDVENYPGVVGEHATGRGLVTLMRQQARSFGAQLADSGVLSADFSSRPFRLRVNGSQEELKAEAVILACGAESRWLQVEGEHSFRGRGVSACATCDGFLFRGQDVAVIGGGDTAMEEALHLARSSRSVTLVHRGDRFRASKILASRVLNHSAIRIRWNTVVDSMHGKDSLTHLMVKSQGGKGERLDVAAAFVAIGHDPQTAFLRGQVDMDDSGYIALRGQGTATSVPGVFAAGDVADHVYRQAVTASGTGAMAALDVERYLNKVE